jgi:hypothetical protein
VAFSVLHHLILWLRLPDLAALMVLALPIVFYIAYCTVDSRSAILRASIRIYLPFAGVVLTSAALVLWLT